MKVEAKLVQNFSKDFNYLCKSNLNLFVLWKGVCNL